jgi:DNA-binding response OmpR family regulator
VSGGRRVVVITSADPLRSAVLAALEASRLELRRLSHPCDPDQIASIAAQLIVFDTQEGTPIGPEVQRLVDQPRLHGVPILLVVDHARLSVVERLPGVADFVVKPFASDELRLRAARLLKPQQSDRWTGIIEVGPLAVDSDAHEVRVHGRAVQLTFQEFVFLRFLAAHPERAFSREELLRRVWSYDYIGGTRTVDIHVRRLRAKLGDSCASAIQTVRNVGYKFAPALLQAAEHPSIR